MRVLVVLLLFVSSTPSFATSEERFGHLYVAAGELFGIGSIRFGGKKWEAGLLNRRSVGVVAVTYDGPLYLNYGIMTNLNSVPGLFGAMGYEKTFWKFLFFRSELNIGHALDNFSSSEVHLGLGVYW